MSLSECSKNYYPELGQENNPAPLQHAQSMAEEEILFIKLTGNDP